MYKTYEQYQRDIDEMFVQIDQIQYKQQQFNKQTEEIQEVQKQINMLYNELARCSNAHEEKYYALVKKKLEILEEKSSQSINIVHLQINEQYLNKLRMLLHEQHKKLLSLQNH